MTTTFDAYLEFTCADAATQSELWKQSIDALTKNPRTKFAPKQKPVYALTMSRRTVLVIKEVVIEIDVTNMDARAFDEALALKLRKITNNLVGAATREYDAMKRTK